ncbi:MAG: hypothetical protein E7644_09420, partial [Ruminococcaceae bacterium]|nr:hypothetical protein [Oscillospiraceae bacterium]
TPRYEPLYRELYERCVALDEALTRQDADAVATALSTPYTHAPAKGGLPKRTPEFAEIAKLASAFRKELLEFSEKCGGFTAAEITEGSLEAASLLRLLYRVLSEYESTYTAAKREREVAEFADVSRAAYRLLVEPDGSATPLARSIGESYAAIYIDEYQDVDAMQDATFRAIAKPRGRFMVGDIKQSIYRFRGADPTVFAGYKKTFPQLAEATPDDDSATIFMSDCFRCDENVVRFSNAVSGALFTRCRDSIGYTSEDDLNFQKPKPFEGYLSPKSRLMILHSKKKSNDPEEDEEENADVEVGEAHMIVAEIERLLREERKADGTPITPGDIAVLSRSASFAKNITDLLSAAGIPCNDTSKSLFFENPDVLCMYSLLSAIDNPLRDIYLASVLRSPFFGFTLSDLVSIRNGADRALSLYEAVEAMAAAENDPLSARCAAFLQRLAHYREKATVLPVDKLLRYLYRDTAVLAFATGDQGEQSGRRNANLLQLYEYARSFESTGFKGLYQFVRYVEDVMSSGAELPSPDGPANAVSLLTIHHSKGLEYPVCFVAGAGKRFNQRDLTPPLLCDNDLGCGIRLPNASVFSRANTFSRMAISLAIKQKNLEEEMRVLYVAMTRARERLYVTAVTNTETLDARISLMTSPHTDFFKDSGNTYLDWILAALDGIDHTPFLEITRIEKQDLIATEEKEQVKAPAPPVDTDRVACLRRTLEERFDFTYPFAHLTKLPAKLSVSRLSPEVLDVYDQQDAATPADLDAPDVERLLHTFEKAPLFDRREQQLSAAERGTATHEFLQFCDLENAARNGVQAELARLIDAHFLPPEASGAVRPEELERFFESDLYREIAAARETHREQRFNIFLPAADFTDKEELRLLLGDEKILVQGVIDLFFINDKGELVLCDYKTDRLTDAELRDANAAAKTLFARHGTQLSYYKEALLQLCGRYPDKTLIYSLPLGQALSEPDKN